MEHRLKKMEKRIDELESRIITLEALFVEKKGFSDKDMCRMRDIEEMKRDPDAWNIKQGGRRRHKPTAE